MNAAENDATHQKLLKSQRADVGYAIENADLDVNDFEWDEANSNHLEYTQVPVIKLKSSEFQFIFDKALNQYSNEYWEVRFSPGTEGYWGYLSTTSWNDVRAEVNKWAKLVRRELDAKDPWEFDEDNDFSQGWNSSNEKFSLDELESLDRGLDSVEQFLIENSSKDVSELKEISEGISYLKEAAKSSGKRDWLMLFIGWFITKGADWSVSNIHWHEVVKVLIKGSKLLLIGQ